MANKLRSINTHFWTDTYIIDLDPIEKLLFLYLLTNPLTNIAGCYEISLKQIAFDTGIDRDMVSKILGRFEKQGKIVHREGWLLIRNFLKNQNLNTNMQIGVETLLDRSPAWCRETLSKPFEAFETHPLNRKGIEREVEGEREGEPDKPKPAQPTAADFGPPRIDQKTLKANHPALVAVRNLTGTQPDRATWDGLIDILGVDPDLARLAVCFRAWVMKGFKKTNYGWVTDWFVHGIPENRQNNGHDARTTPADEREFKRMLETQQGVKNG